MQCQYLGIALCKREARVRVWCRVHCRQMMKSPAIWGPAKSARRGGVSAGLAHAGNILDYFILQI